VSVLGVTVAGALYDDLPANQRTYRLRSMVCYYGAHYEAFVLLPDTESWVLFDDANVGAIGGWRDVVAKCRAGRIQPSVLFYEAQHAFAY
jgi:ubiquitin C-terminal hydrolase